MAALYLLLLHICSNATNEITDEITSNYTYEYEYVTESYDFDAYKILDNADVEGQRLPYNQSIVESDSERRMLTPPKTNQENAVNLNRQHQRNRSHDFMMSSLVLAKMHSVPDF